jgi:hypothetical protein
VAVRPYNVRKLRLDDADSAAHYHDVFEAEKVPIIFTAVL